MRRSFVSENEDRCLLMDCGPLLGCDAPQQQTNSRRCLAQQLHHLHCRRQDYERRGQEGPSNRRRHYQPGPRLASCLHRDRDEIFIADPNEPEQGASFGNAGVFGTSSVVPMSMPGVIRQVPAWPRDPDRRAGRANSRKTEAVAALHPKARQRQAGACLRFRTRELSGSYASRRLCYTRFFCGWKTR
jgi:hypothetical protein